MKRGEGMRDSPCVPVISTLAHGLITEDSHPRTFSLVPLIALGLQVYRRSDNGQGQIVRVAAQVRGYVPDRLAQLDPPVLASGTAAISLPHLRYIRRMIVFT